MTLLPYLLVILASVSPSNGSTKAASSSSQVELAVLADSSSPLYNHQIYDLGEIVDLELEASSSYIQEVGRAVADDGFFAEFKSRKVAPKIFTVFYSHFAATPGELSNMDVALYCVDEYAPHLLAKFRQLAAQDLRVGNPELREFTLPNGMMPAAAMGRQDNRQDNPRVQASTHVPKFIYETMLLEKAFGVRAGDKGFGGMHVVEIGGGYGGMANTFAEFHDVASYTVVDLGSVNLLVEKYLRAVDSKLLLSGGGSRLRTVNALTTVTTEAVREATPTIDLLISFWCLSEQKKNVVDDYIERYVQRAVRGYIQLDYDDNEVGGYGDGQLLYNALQMFKKIYEVQPSAVLLPPSPCGVYLHHRITWGPDAGERADKVGKFNRFPHISRVSKEPNWG